jgi:ribonuclease-3
MRRTTVLLKLQRALGYELERSELLQQALRHSSAAHEQGVPSFERLEFLGDAALSHVVAALLFARWPEATEGELTRARASLVRETSLASLAERLGLPAAVELGSGLDGANPGAAVLADALEAVLGALLLDGGWRAFKAAVARWFAPLVASLDRSQLSLEEPKSTLQEFAQSRGLSLPAYRQVEIRGPAHRQIFVFEVELEGRVLGRGDGPSKKAAQQAAARNALDTLNAPGPSPSDASS